MPEHYARIFLLSHMRALTSLAGHILGSHPWINGYFEMHIRYEDASALDKQLALLRETEALKANSHYIFDKLLHNDYPLKLEQLGSADIRILVSLLQPEQTIRSIVNLFEQKESGELYASPVEAANYYIERVQALADFCLSARQPYYYYDADLFRSAPDSLLAILSSWLELKPRLSERYQIFSQTGKARKGDSSARIHSGTINRSSSDYSHIDIPEEALTRAQAVYRECRQKMITHAAESICYTEDPAGSDD